MFSVEEYNKANEKVIEMIKSTHDWENTEGFIADGLIDPEKYSKSKVKIVVFLAESYGYDECKIVDIQGDDILGVGHKDRHTSRKVSFLLWYLNNHINDSQPKNMDGLIEKNSDLLQMPESNTKELQEALAMSGWINVKKASKHIDEFGNDATRQDYSEIYNSVSRNKNILLEQIHATNPDLMIICSHPVINGLCDNEIIKIKGEREMNKIFFTEDGKRIFFTTHPGYYADWGYDGIYDMYKTVVKEYPI